MDPLTVLAAAGLLAAGIAVGSALRRRTGGDVDARGAGDAPTGAPAVPEPPATEPPVTAPPAHDAPPVTAPTAHDAPEPAAPTAPPAVVRTELAPRAPRPRPVAARRTTLADLAADAGAPEPVDLGGGLTPGTTLVVAGATRAATATLAATLLDAVGDRPVLRVTPPGRHDRTDAAGEVVGTVVHEPLADPGDLPVRGLPDDAVVLVEQAERHLRRGLDPSVLARLEALVPRGHVVLLLGGRPEGSIGDDARERLTGGVLPPSVGPDVDARDADVDDVLADLAGRDPVAIDVIEAVAYAVAAGRLPDVPVATVLRLAAGLAGGDVDAPVTPTALAGVLDAAAQVDPDGRVLRSGGTDAQGMPTTLGVDPLLVARCVDGVAELPERLLAVLLDGDADDVERLEVARVLAGTAFPRHALPALDGLVAAGGPHATEARLVRGIVGDRLDRPSALDDYLAVVATGPADAPADLAVHARFLAAGLLEVGGDVDAAVDAYRAVIDTEHPVHAGMAAFNLAWIVERSGDTDAAVDAYRELAGGTHRDAAPMAALNLATILQRQKRSAEAESWFRVAVDSDHHDAAPMAAVALGLMLERNRRPREARSLYRYAAASGHEEAAPAALRRLGAPHRAAELRGRGRGAR